MKYINLHAHSTAGSPFDAIGYPDEHIDFCIKNGMKAMALTDHGNACGLSYQVLKAKKLKKEGVDFKPIFGVEAYFHPSIREWQELKETLQAEKDEIKGAVAEDEEETKRGGGKGNPLNHRRHIVLLAQNQTGLYNIFQLISKSFHRPYFYRFPRIDYDLLKQHSEGVIGLSACLGGIYAGDMWRNMEKGDGAILKAMVETTDNMRQIFGDRWYGELQWLDSEHQHTLNKFLIHLHKTEDLPLVSTADVHYPSPEAWKDRTLYKKINPKFINKEAGQALPQTVDEVGYELYPKNGTQMWEAYEKYSKKYEIEYDPDVVKRSIENTHHIAFDRIDDFLPDNQVRLPSFLIPDGKTADEVLREMCEYGLAQLGIDDDGEAYKQYSRQMYHELDVIKDRGFSQYFVTMKEISDRAKDQMLVGPGRGSAAGSLISYLLGITQVDPLKWGLMFSRFMRKDATDYPDIDYDVSEPMLIKEKLIEEWGANNVVPISNWSTLQLRSLIKDIARFYQIPFTEVNKVTSVMEKEATGPAKRERGMKAGVINLTFEDVMKHSESLKKFLDKYPDVKTHVEALVGQVRQCSRHAGGVVIGEELNKRMPLIVNGDVTQTPWSEGQNVRHLEPLGFIKFDLLGLGTLRMFEDAITLILKRHHNVPEPTFKDIKDYYEKHLHPDVIDFSDQKVYEKTFCSGRFAGVFQFAEAPMQAFAKSAQPKSLIDITALTSMWRPGPMDADVPENYLEAKKDPSLIKYIHPIVKKYTESTHGFLIFQEQIAQVAHAMGKDVSEDEGNMLRKVLTKKGTGKAVEVKNAIHDKFIAGCVEKGLTEKQGEDQWQIFINFAGYGFNKSHALCYSVISFQCAWFLTYFPAEWLCAYLNVQDEKEQNKKEKAISVVQSYGYDIEPVDINTSGKMWEPHPSNPKVLVQPLTSLKGMGDKIVEKILKNRPYNTIDECILGDRKIGKKALDVLIKCNGITKLQDERFRNRKHMWEACANNHPTSKKKLVANIEEFKYCDEFTPEEQIEYLHNLTGVYPIHLVINSKVKARLDEMHVRPIGEWDPDLLYVWFIPIKKVDKKTTKGRLYWILDVIDDTGTITKIKCWAVTADTKVHFNHPYMSVVDGQKIHHDPQWGFSTRSLRKSFVLIG